MQNNTKKENHTVRNIVAGAAVVGAGILTAKALSDKKFRKNIKANVKKVQDKGEEVLSQLNDSKDEVIRNLTKKFEDLKARIEKTKQSQELQNKIDVITTNIEEMKNSNEDDISKLIDQAQENIEDLRKSLK